MSKQVSELSGHFPGVLRLCERMLGNPDDAADAAQETFRRALQQPAGTITDPRRWLAAVARNVCRDELRRRERFRVVGEVVEAAVAVEPERVVLGGMFVGELLDQLTGAERRVVAARLVEDRATGEVAAALGVAPVTTRVLMARGLGRLRRYLAESPGRLGGAGAYLPTAGGVASRLQVALGRLRLAVGASGPRAQPFLDGIAIASAVLLGLLPHLPAHPLRDGGAAAAVVRPAATVHVLAGRPATPPLPAVPGVDRLIASATASVVRQVPGGAVSMTVQGCGSCHGAPQPIFPGGPAPPAVPPIVVGPVAVVLEPGGPISVTVCPSPGGC